MTPILFLSLIILTTAGASLYNVIQRRRWQRQLQQLATEHRMAYSQYDRFGLANRVAAHYPIPGVASLRVIDLLYASEAAGYRYLFCAEYTSGIIRSKHRMLRAVTFFESRSGDDASTWSTLNLGAAELPLLEQYRQLAATIATD